MTRPILDLGALLPADGNGDPLHFQLPADHLVTHGVIVGMTGSGKTGLAMVLVEEALRNGIPVLAIDVKGDLPNLMLTGTPGDPATYLPWIDARRAEHDGGTADSVAASLVAERTSDLASWQLTDGDVAKYAASIAPRVLTPGTSAGEMVHVLSSLEQPSPLWTTDPEAARDALAASISLVLRLVGRDPDPARSRDHVVLSHFAEARLRNGRPADLASLLHDLAEPPVATLGAMTIDEYLSERDRRNLATALNTLLASPTFESWRKGVPLDVGAWLTPSEGSDGKTRTPAVVFSVAHLDDEERALILGLLFEQILAWVRTLPGTSDLRALVLFDEVFGYLPPHPANPPAKRPLMALMKQARAFGVGMLLATQNPMDLDYRALSNAGVWFVGRLQTDADRERVVEGLAGATERGGHVEGDAMAARLKVLMPRWFVVRDVRMVPNTWLLNTRATLSWMRGPMTRMEMRAAGKVRAVAGATSAGVKDGESAVAGGMG